MYDIDVAVLLKEVGDIMNRKNLLIFSLIIIILLILLKI